MSNDAGFKASNDALIVAGLMDELVELFGKSWQLEQQKQQKLTSRFRVDVPLLILMPCSWKEAFKSRQPVAALACIFLAACVALSLNVAIAMACLGVERKWGAVGVGFFLLLGSVVAGSMCFFLICPAHDLRMPALRLVLKYYGPLALSCVATTAGTFSSVIALDPEWRRKHGQIWGMYAGLGQFTVCSRIADSFAVWESPVLQATIESGARQLPSFRKRFVKGLKLGFLIALAFEIVIGYIQACVTLRSTISTLPPALSVSIVMFVNISKQGLMYIFASVYLPIVRPNFASTDSFVYSVNALLTFSMRLLVTAVSSTTGIFVTLISKQSPK